MACELSSSDVSSSSSSSSNSRGYTGSHPSLHSRPVPLRKPLKHDEGATSMRKMRSCTQLLHEGGLLDQLTTGCCKPCTPLIKQAQGARTTRA
jgi:hypothetical protein